MPIEGNAQQLWIFVGEKDRWQGKPLYLAIMEVLQRRGCAGATVLRGLAGFGANSLIHTVLLLELSTDLPIVITLVDRQDRIRRILPEISEMVGEGLITLTPVEVVKYTHRIPGAFPPGLTVSEVMTREVIRVAPQTPIPDALKELLDHGLSALPVVEGEGRALGWITEEDLLSHAGKDLPAAIATDLSALGVPLPASGTPRTVAEIMSRDLDTVRQEATVSEAAARMAEGGLKRLAVVDAGGALLGIISRSDVLKTVSDALDAATTETRPQVCLTASVREAMRSDIPSVGLSTPLPDALDRLISSPGRELIVLDDQRHPAGIITEGDVLQRAGKPVRPEVLRTLTAWIRGGHVAHGLALAAKGKVAEEVMTHPVVTVREDSAVSEALKVMIEQRIKLLPVVDAEGRCVGSLSRSALLASLAKASAQGNRR